MSGFILNLSLPKSEVSMSVRLYIGNLPKEEASSRTTSGFCRRGMLLPPKSLKPENRQMPWFWFVTVNDDEQADQIIEKFNGRLFKDTP